MGLTLKIAALAYTCSAVTIAANDIADLSAVDELLRKGIEKVEDDTAERLENVLTDMIKAEWDDEDDRWSRN